MNEEWQKAKGSTKLSSCFPPTVGLGRNRSMRVGACENFSRIAEEIGLPNHPSFARAKKR
jgi:hypothetical protein